MIFGHFKAGVLFTSIRFIPLLEHIVQMWLPTVLRSRQDHFRLSKDKIHRRLNLGTDSVDFMSYILKNNDKDGMSTLEIEATFNVLILAGTETTAMALSAMTNYLIANSGVLQRLAKEVRGSFQTEKDITLAYVARLPYLPAVIEEVLRIAPQVPVGLHRLVPSGGATVCGEWLPGGVSTLIYLLRSYGDYTAVRTIRCLRPWL